MLRSFDARALARCAALLLLASCAVDPQSEGRAGWDPAGGAEQAADLRVHAQLEPRPHDASASFRAPREERGNADGGTGSVGDSDAQVDGHCDVALRVETERGASELILTREDRGQRLLLLAENRTAQTQTFSYADPCWGPPLTGLGRYDARRVCLAGACQPQRPPIGVTLAPGERKVLGTGAVDVTPDTCNRAGLAVGTYDVGYLDVAVTGARTCSEPLRLQVL